MLMIEFRYVVRLATSVDLDAIRAALACAIDWREPSVTATPEKRIEETGHAYLLAQWGRKGDTAVVAESTAGPVGAAWYRYWTEAVHSYGYIDPVTPELGIGVDPRFRGQGVGSSLLSCLLETAVSQGVRAISLSVECDNPALHLYERFSFVRYNRIGNAWIMHKRFEGKHRR